MKKALFFLLFFLSYVEVKSADYSGTLPVMFINTTDSIRSKTEYVAATYYIDNMGIDSIQAVGSTDAPLPLQIRGRGNWTWFGDFKKKSYKIKLERGRPLLGMASNKHFALLAHADNSQCYFRNTAGFWISRRLGMDFTPDERPVEVVLNGEYIGLYILTETIRVGKNRLNLTKQQDLETDPALIDGGWLVELDNNEDEQQIQLPVDGTDLGWFWVTYDSPEVLSDVQKNYLASQFTEILNTVYCADKESTDWEQLIDINSLVDYYLVNEITDHLEAFLGSCFLHKDHGEAKWKFGPVWDLGHAFNGWHEKNRFIYDYDGWDPCIMQELARFPHFQTLLRERWLEVEESLYPALTAFLYDYAERIKAACASDHRRWPDYGTDNAKATVDLIVERLNEKRAFLISQWGPHDAHIIGGVPTDCQSDVYYSLQGMKLRERPVRAGIYFYGGCKIIVK